MDAQVDDVPMNQELENILEMSAEEYETSRGSYAELRPLRVSRGESIVGSGGDIVVRKQSKLKNSMASRHKPSIAARFEEIPEDDADSDGEVIQIKYSPEPNAMYDSKRSYHSKGQTVSSVLKS
jgi:hypothetical protein